MCVCLIERKAYVDFELKLMEIDVENLGIPDTKYSCKVTMPSAELQRIVRDLKILGDTCTISVFATCIRFTVKGDTGKGSVFLRNKDEVDIEIETPVSLTFSLRYLNLFAKASSLSESMTLEMSDKLPIKCAYSMGEKIGSLHYYLAPQMEEESG